MKVNGSTILWSSKRQSCVAQSTCKAEYMAASRAASHLVWTQQALGELTGTGLKPMSDLLVGNKPAESLIKDNKTSDRSKHIDVHFHFVQEHFIKGEYQVQHVASKDNLADFAPKPCPNLLWSFLANRFAQLVVKLIQLLFWGTSLLQLF
jgi:hypothetical protein